MKKNKAQLMRRWEGLFYILPWVLGFLIFTLYPLLSSLYYSFTDFSIANTPKWVGLQNYIELFTADRLAIPSMITTFKYVFISVPAKLIFALLVAMVLNQKLKGIGILRTVYYLPSILGGSVAIAVLWRFLFRSDGIVNLILQKVGLPTANWIGDPKLALGTVALLGVWQFGSSMVLFLAALKQVPPELYEAARVDGASRARQFFSITLPMISPILFFNINMQLINAFQEFTGPYVITSGGPMNATYVFAIHLYNSAFKYFRMGYASALSWVLFLVILVFTLALFRFSDKHTYYQDGR